MSDSHSVVRSASKGLLPRGWVLLGLAAAGWGLVFLCWQTLQLIAAALW